MEKSAGNNHAGSGWPWARENGESDGRPCLCECRPASQTGEGLQGSDFRSRAVTSVRNGEDHSGTMGRTIGKYQGPVGGNPHAPAYCHDARGTAETVSGCSEDGGISAKNMALQDWIMGWDTKPDRLHHPMRFVVDRQISAGAGHSGYPAMATKDWTNSIATGSIIHSGSWGLWHELGHNHQSPPLRWKARRRYPSTYSPWCVK